MANKTSALLVSRKQKMNRTGNRHRIMKRNVLREFKTSNKKFISKVIQERRQKGQFISALINTVLQVGSLITRVISRAINAIQYVQTFTV